MKDFARQNGGIQPFPFPWWFGIGSSGDPVYESLVVPAQGIVRPFASALTKAAGSHKDRVIIGAPSWAAITLDGVSGPGRWNRQVPFEAFDVHFERVERDDHGIRLIATEQDRLAHLAAHFGANQPEEPYGLLLLFANGRIPEDAARALIKACEIQLVQPVVLRVDQVIHRTSVPGKALRHRAIRTYALAA